MNNQYPLKGLKVESTKVIIKYSSLKTTRIQFYCETSDGRMLIYYKTNFGESIKHDDATFFLLPGQSLKEYYIHKGCNCYELVE